MNINIKDLLKILIGYWATCLPPSVNKFFTSNPCIVIKQYDAINTNIEKNIIIEPINININNIIFIIVSLIFKFIKDITSIISDCIILDIFEKFNYVALGHLHSYQSVKSDKVRYSGSILKYSAIPPQTPAIILLLFDFFNFFDILSLPINIFFISFQ